MKENYLPQAAGVCAYADANTRQRTATTFIMTT